MKQPKISYLWKKKEKLLLYNRRISIGIPWMLIYGGFPMTMSKPSFEGGQSLNDCFGRWIFHATQFAVKK